MYVYVIPVLSLGNWKSDSLIGHSTGSPGSCQGGRSFTILPRTPCDLNFWMTDCYSLQAFGCVSLHPPYTHTGSHISLNLLYRQGCLYVLKSWSTSTFHSLGWVPKPWLFLQFSISFHAVVECRWLKLQYRSLIKHLCCMHEAWIPYPSPPPAYETQGVQTMEYIKTQLFTTKAKERTWVRFIEEQPQT